MACNVDETNHTGRLNKQEPKKQSRIQTKTKGLMLKNAEKYNKSHHGLKEHHGKIWRRQVNMRTVLVG